MTVVLGFVAYAVGLGVLVYVSERMQARARRRSRAVRALIAEAHLADDCAGDACLTAMSDRAHR